VIIVETKTKAGSTCVKFRVKVIVEKDDPGYHAFAPSLPGLHMPGDSIQEAKENAKEAIALMLKAMIEDGDPISIDLAVPFKQNLYEDTQSPLFSSIEEILIKL
jgi:predicted RNase H-like HicB family nuclease